MTSPRSSSYPFAALFGLLLGFSLSRMGFSSWTEVHEMFTFADLRLVLTFAGAVVLTGLVFAALARDQVVSHKPFHRGSILGGVIFGAGWAITGACPSVPLVQLGEGKLPALATVVGVAFGTLLYQRIAAPRLRWDVNACG